MSWQDVELEDAVLMDAAAEKKDTILEAPIVRGKKRKVALFIAYVGAGYSVSTLPKQQLRCACKPSVSAVDLYSRAVVHQSCSADMPMSANRRLFLRLRGCI